MDRVIDPRSDFQKQAEAVCAGCGFPPTGDYESINEMKSPDVKVKVIAGQDIIAIQFAGKTKIRAIDKLLKCLHKLRDDREAGIIKYEYISTEDHQSFE